MSVSTHHTAHPSAYAAKPQSSAADPAGTLRRALRQHAAGVTVITVPGPAGFTATSFTSVSLEPALVSFYLGLSASTVRAVRAAERFAVHVLGPGNEALAEQFARSRVDRFAGVPWTPGPGGLPLLDAAPLWLTARTTLLREIGDHLLVVGEVEDSGGEGGPTGLVHHEGGFREAAPLGPARRE
ncbi:MULTISPECIES: flavin reductase family protein [unclassified Streptomyces]|uniref:flavin reductase family protein n=1 Tax=unclassified Streptomyces TaxID=2593676 RepID=UPI002DDA9DC8|nr:flavin reductase family protein [Streptomyces sp. NBC_01775]WSB75164.1 flavin reductase family protein [Streptomyces sp. NBC_01775]WSS45370.1 flavin reductase family protein [Streptomyces sp. NBC_01187]